MATPSTVLISVDFSDFSKQAFHWYLERLHQPGNKIYLVHCIEMPSMPSRDTWEQQTKIGKEKSIELKSLFAAELEKKQIEAEYIFDFEKPGEFIVDTAQKIGANFIVMGTRGMGKLRRTILGSVSTYVLHHASCPVMVCRSPKD